MPKLSYYMWQFVVSLALLGAAIVFRSFFPVGDALAEGFSKTVTEQAASFFVSMSIIR